MISVLTGLNNEILSREIDQSQSNIKRIIKIGQFFYGVKFKISL